MKSIRVLLIFALSAAVLAAILAPGMLQGILPDEVISLLSLEEFPLLGTCVKITGQLVNVVRGYGHFTAEIITQAIGPNFLDEAVSLLMVAVLTIPVSLALGFLLYKPLYEGALTKAILYASLNLCSVMIAWVLYRQLYFRLLIQGVIQQNIPDAFLQQIANYATQLLSALLVGAVTIKIALTLVAAHIVLHKMILPIIGTFIRTLLFAFLTAELMILYHAPQDWQVVLPMMAVTLIVSGLSDGMFGS